jgi:MinD-like ATPase involved in chromosome partitioning or flagellar assembly/tetratricopeptide (TPR) repeat protein
MLLANIAWLLANEGKRVLMVDWDLEAPGLHRYMAPFLTDAQMTGSDGLIDMILAYAAEAVDPTEANRDPGWISNTADVLDYAVSVNWQFENGGTLSLLPAGRQGPGYSTKVNTLNWQNLYDRLGGFRFFEHLKESMHSNFDYSLIDSRTGVSDTAGICTVQFPDTLVVCFTLNNQSIEGAAAVAKSVLDQKSSNEFQVFPVPMRLDNSESEKLLRRWKLAKDRFANLLPREQRESYWDDVAMQYVPKFAYEEILAPFANRPDDPATINLLARARRLTGLLTGSDVLLTPVDESVRRNVLAHFAGDSVEKSPLDAQRAAIEERERAELVRMTKQREEDARLAAARASGKQEAETVLRASTAKTRFHVKVLGGVAVILLLVISGLAFSALYSRSAISNAQSAVADGDRAVLASNWTDALSSYSIALETLSTDADLYRKRAVVLWEMKNPVDALKDFDKALALKPDDYDLLVARGEARLSENDAKGSIEDLNRALKLGGQARPWELLAAAYEHDSQFDEAAKAYTARLETFTADSDDDVLLARADLYLKKLNRRSDGVRDLTRVAGSTQQTKAAFAQAELKNLGIRWPADSVNGTIRVLLARNTPKALALELEKALSGARFKVSTEFGAPSGYAEVLYFRSEDADLAKRAKEMAEVTLAKERRLITISPKLARPTGKLVPGELEMWLPDLEAPSPPRAPVQAIPRR